jgi:signal peptidase I
MILNILSNIFLTLVIVCTIVLLIPLIPGLGQWYQLVVIQSASMEPAVPVGSVAVYKPVEEYLPNDIIVYLYGDGVDSKTIVHRVDQKRTSSDGLISYRTIGDANSQQSSAVVYHGQVKGKVLTTIPQVGYAIQYMKSPRGMTGMLLLLMGLLIVSELVRKR